MTWWLWLLLGVLVAPLVYGLVFVTVLVAVGSAEVVLHRDGRRVWTWRR